MVGRHPGIYAHEATGKSMVTLLNRPPLCHGVGKQQNGPDGHA